MREPTVAFYVHHDGAGHAVRTAAIAAHLSGRVTAASSLDLREHPGFDGLDTVLLPDDVPEGEPGDVTANGTFHHAPERLDVGVPRMQALLRWLDRTRPDVVVVDVSVEVACLVRLAGVPVVVVRMHGERCDPPHVLAYRLADLLLAPFSEALDAGGIPYDLLAKTVHCGAIGPSAQPPDLRPHLRPRVVVVWGRGTEPPPGPLLDDAALATPDWDWEMVGPRCPIRPPTMVHHHGWVDDVDAVLAGADVVVGPPGDGLVSMVARTGLPFVALPGERPFREQHIHAEQLRTSGVALVRDGWPGPHGWPPLLEAARGMDPARVEVLGHAGAAERAAGAIRGVAVRAPVPC